MKYAMNPETRSWPPSRNVTRYRLINMSITPPSINILKIIPLYRGLPTLFKAMKGLFFEEDVSFGYLIG
jgi:hypothetical protein